MSERDANVWLFHAVSLKNNPYSNDIQHLVHCSLSQYLPVQNFTKMHPRVLELYCCHDDGLYTTTLHTYQKLQKDSAVPATLRHALFHMLQSLRHCSSCSTTVQRWNDTQVVAFNLTNARLSQKLCTNPVLYGNSLTPKHMKHNT